MLDIPEDERLEVVRDSKMGRGVKAKIDFKEGEFVVEYSGEFMCGTTGRFMEKEHARNRAGSFLFFFGYKSDEFCIDATSESSKMGRRIYHSRRKANVMTKFK